MTDTWIEAFTWHVQQLPYQLAHMRTIAEETLKAQDTSAVVVDSSGDKARLPYQVDAADDADELWVTLVLFAREVAERTGNPAPRPVRERMWQGRDEPQGLPVCTPEQAHDAAQEITRWLTTCAHHIAYDPNLHDAPEDLIRVIRKMRNHYPQAEPRQRAYRPRPCPIPACGERTIEPIYDAHGLAGYRCDNCEAQWDREGAPVERIDIRER